MGIDLPLFVVLPLDEKVNRWAVHNKRSRWNNHSRVKKEVM